MKKIGVALLCCSFLFMFLGCDSISNLNPKTNIEPTPVVTENTDQNKNVKEESKKVSVTLYFANEDNSAVLSEKREIDVHDGAVMRSAVEALIEGPRETGLRKTIPDGTKLLGIKRDNNTAVVDFSEEYKNANDIAEVVERISIVNTLTEITGIEKVRILVQGKELVGPSGKPFGDLSRASLDDNGRPVPGAVKKIVLYFGGSNTDALVAEKRDVALNKGQSLERIIFEELCKGPKSENLYPTMPEKTKLLSVETTKDGTCKLNLSKEFVDNAPGGSSGESITLNSIVNSLTELPNVKRVQFLVEGKIREGYTHLEMDKPFERDPSTIKK